MRVLGIDPGLATTGFAVIEDNGTGRSALGGLELLEAGILKTPAGTEIPDRLKMLHADCVELLKEYHPEALAIEELFFNKNVTTAINVSQARGVILLACSDMPMMSYSPLQIKKQICGYGQAKKPQIQQMTQRYLNLSQLPKQDDAADAMAIALCYILQYRNGIVVHEQLRSA